MTGACVDSLHVSNGGVPKNAVLAALVTERGLEGDRQRDLRYHGGPDRAVVLFSLEIIRTLQAEGHSITPGATGENVTVAGLDWAAVTPGAIVEAGPVRLLITRFADPCRKIAGAFLRDNFMRISPDRHPGFSRVCARVLTGGLLHIGDPVRVMPAADQESEPRTRG